MYIHSSGKWHGPGRYVYDLAYALKGQYDVSVTVGSTGALVDRLHAAHIPTHSLTALTRDIDATQDSTAFFQLLNVFRKEKPDIVHLNSSKAGALGAIAARIAGVPRIVYTVHGWAFNEPVSSLARVFRWVVSLITMLAAHRTITVSQFDMLLSPLGLHSVTVHNGIAPLDCIPREEARRIICARAGISENAFIFGTIAELHTNKGLDILIEATFAVDNIHVVVIGEGEERATLETLITELNLTDRVHLIGFIADAARYLQAFDAFVLPSRKEGLPYAILEAGSAGVPVIASAVGGVPEIVGDQISGDLVHAFSIEKLAESLQEFSEQPNTIRHYAEALSARVARYFNLEDMVKKTVDVYEH
jgi:glycosyltransferase involved in cell wall biosynthesis